MTRRIIGVLLAIILAAVGTAAVLFYVRTASNTVANGQRAVHVLVAKARIAAGTSGERIRSDALTQEVVMPASSIPADALSEVPTDLDKLVLTADVQSNQLLLRGMFGQATKLSGGLEIPEGLVAVSVAVTDPEQVAGYVRPGSQIAIFDFFTLLDPEWKQQSGQDNKATQLLLPRVQVLAVGTFGANGVTAAQVQQQGDTTKQQQNGAQIVVTVAVNQLDATRLIQASQTGTLYFALLTDSSDVKPGAGVSNRTLFS
jgi:pilus assembly protein CpaB